MTVTTAKCRKYRVCGWLHVCTSLYGCWWFVDFCPYEDGLQQLLKDCSQNSTDYNLAPHLVCNEVKYPGHYLVHLLNYQMIAANVLACKFCQCEESFIQSILHPTICCSLSSYRKSNMQTWRSNRPCAIPQRLSAHNQICHIMGRHKLGSVESGLLNS